MLLSAIILTKGDEENLARTRASVTFCDEILVLRHPYLTDWSKQRNSGLDQAKGEWVLFLDDDEVVSADLAAEIQKALQNNHAQDFYFRRTDYFWGRELKFGETASVRLLRLAQKNAGRWQGKVHEIWKINGPTSQLKNALQHFPHPTISEFVNHINHYTNIVAAEKKQFSLGETVIFPVGKFLQNYFLRLGFLDGFPGFVMAFMMSLHSLIVRVKTYDLLRNS